MNGRVSKHALTSFTRTIRSQHAKVRGQIRKSTLIILFFIWLDLGFFTSRHWVSTLNIDGQNFTRNGSEVCTTGLRPYTGLLFTLLLLAKYTPLLTFFFFKMTLLKYRPHLILLSFIRVFAFLCRLYLLISCF